MDVPITEQWLRAAQIARIKQTLEENGCNVGNAAIVLGMHRTKLSQMLNGNKSLKSWWTKMKEAKKKRNRAARRRRWLDRRAQMGLG